MPINLGDIPTGSPPTGAPNIGGVGSSGDFRPISRYISETVQDRVMLLWNANRNSYVLYRLRQDITARSRRGGR